MTAREWQALVREHSPLVWRVVYRLVAHQADAADCMQETFVAAWKISRRQIVKNWPGLLQHLATARALDHLRHKARQAKHLATSDAADIPSPLNGPAANAQLSELAGQLRVALVGLPPKLSEVYCLRHLNGMSYQEIAVEMKMNVNAVGVALHRATERLRAALTPVMMDDRKPERSL